MHVIVVGKYTDVVDGTFPKCAVAGDREARLRDYAIA